MSTYLGIPPAKCDICDVPTPDEFYDAALKAGPWANTCTGCFNAYGIGLGTGRGQHWLKSKGTDQFVKVEG